MLAAAAVLASTVAGLVALDAAPAAAAPMSAPCAVAARDDLVSFFLPGGDGSGTPGLEITRFDDAAATVDVPVAALLANDETCGEDVEVATAGLDGCGAPTTVAGGGVTFDVPDGCVSTAVTFSYDVLVGGASVASARVTVVLDPITYFQLVDGGDDSVGQPAGTPDELAETGGRTTDLSIAAATLLVAGVALRAVARRPARRRA